MDNKVMSSASPALDRGLDILELLAGHSEVASLTQIARELDLTPSEIQRPVACLTRRGYLVRDAQSAYGLGAMFFRLAQAHPPHRRLLAAANPAMAEFARKSGESVHLAVRQDNQVLLLGEAQGSGLVRISLQMGATLDAETTVSGRVLLAYDPDRVGQGNAELERQLKEIRTRGHEMAASAYAEGVQDIGVPVFAAGDKRAIAALTVSVIHLKRGGRRLSDLLPDLLICAGEIGVAYGPGLIS